MLVHRVFFARSIHILDVGQCPETPDSRAGRADEVLNLLDIVLDNVEGGMTIWFGFFKVNQVCCVRDRCSGARRGKGKVKGEKNENGFLTRVSFVTLTVE